MEQGTKRLLLIALASVAGLVLAAACVWFVWFSLQFSTYKDSSYGFTIKYPSQWKKVVAPQPGAAVVFVSPRENALDVFQENVNISVQDLPPQAATLEVFTNIVLFQMRKVFSNLTVVESKSVTFGGRPGHWVLFEAKKPDPIKLLTVWTTRGGQQGYILTYVAVTRKYSDYLPLVKEMIRSFHLPF